MIMRSHHLAEEVLLTCYMSQRAGESLDPRVAEHLADCTACAARFDSFASFMLDTRSMADAEADAAFPEERRLAQRHRILKRIAQAQTPGRVISFPGREAGGDKPAFGLTARWAAGAAAAGLFIGYAVGGYLGPAAWQRSGETPVRTYSQQQVIVQRPPEPASVRVGGAQGSASDDDAFLMDLEVALERPRAFALQPFDAMTPLVSDIDARVR